MSKSKEHELFRIASDPGTLADDLAILSVNVDELVRGAVACNPSTPDSVLAVLMNDSSFHVRECLLDRDGTGRLSKKFH